MCANEDNSRQETMFAVCERILTTQEQIAYDAVWNFFISTNDEDFIRLYERGMVDTHEQQDEIYLHCSEWLFDNEVYIADVLDTGKEKVLMREIILPLSCSIEDLLGIE